MKDSEREKTLDLLNTLISDPILRQTRAKEINKLFDHLNQDETTLSEWKCKHQSIYAGICITCSKDFNKEPLPHPENCTCHCHAFCSKHTSKSKEEMVDHKECPAHCPDCGTCLFLKPYHCPCIYEK